MHARFRRARRRRDWEDLAADRADPRWDYRSNAVEPGFIATDLTGAYGFGGQSVADSAEVIVRMATIGKDGPTGTFQENGGELPW